MRAIRIPIEHEVHVHRMLADGDERPHIARALDALRAAQIDGDHLVFEIADEDADEAARWIASYSITGKMCLYFAPPDDEPEDRLGVFVR